MGKPSNDSLDFVMSHRSSFNEITEGAEQKRKRRYQKLILTPWDDTAAKRAATKILKENPSLAAKFSSPLQ